MTPIGKISRGILLGAALLAGGADLGRSMAAQGTTTQAPKYTLEEYNAFTAANTQAVPEQKIKMLDDFVAKYPKSALLVYVYNAYLCLLYTSPSPRD